VDPQFVELVKALTAPLVATGGITGWYLLYRKFDAERAASLREDNQILRDENKDLREEVRKLRADLKGDDV
jgi:cell division protein FtsB